MDFDFNLILVPATLIFFSIWLLDKLVFKQRRQHQQAVQLAETANTQALQAQAAAAQDANLAEQAAQAQRAAVAAESQAFDSRENAFITWAYDFWPILAVVLCVRSFLFEPFNIPSESMVPGLQIGDFILVNKFQYGVRLPILNTKILDTGAPQRGEVFVFRYPGNPKVNYIKRVIGLPGDHIVFDEGQLNINGQAIAKVAEPKMGDVGFENFSLETMGTHTHQVRELKGEWSAENAPFVQQRLAYLPEHLQAPTAGVSAHTDGHHWEVDVPAGHYFAMGDNRDQSADSRFWGFVPEANLSGRAIYIWMQKEPGWHLPSFSRNGKII